MLNQADPSPPREHLSQRESRRHPQLKDPLLHPRPQHQSRFRRQRDQARSPQRREAPARRPAQRNQARNELERGSKLRFEP